MREVKREHGLWSNPGCHLLVLCHWSSYSILLSFSFLPCKMEMGMGMRRGLMFTFHSALPQWRGLTRSGSSRSSFAPHTLQPQTLSKQLHCFFFLNKFIYLFLAVLGPRFCARAFSSCGERGHSSSRCVGRSLSRPLLLRSTGSGHAGSVVVAHGL